MGERRDPQPTADFTKVSDELVKLGVPVRAAMLYGKLAYYTREGRLCYRKWATLAEEVGLKDRTTVYRLLCQLRALKLVEWKRHGQHSNQYWALVPDVAFLQRLRLQGRNVSDVARTQRRKESIGSLKEELKRTPPTPQAKPSHKPASETGDCASRDARVDESALAIIPRSGNAQPREWFEQWWAIYWRKVARKSAEKAFRAQVKTPERFAQVMTATQKQTAIMMARDPDKRPHGATWINGARWDDEPSAPATARKPPGTSLGERVKARWRERIAKGERPL